METSCLAHPPKDPLVIIRQWQLEFLDNMPCDAALCSFFEYWHNIKLDQAKKAGQANDIAEGYGDRRLQDESLIQYHTSAQLRSGIMNLYSEKTIRVSLKRLEKKGVISIMKNPNPKYAFDKTKYFLFHPDVFDKFLNDYTIKRQKELKNGKFLADVVETATSNGKNTVRYGKTSTRCGKTSTGQTPRKPTPAVVPTLLEVGPETTTENTTETKGPFADFSKKQKNQDTSEKIKFSTFRKQLKGDKLQAFELVADNLEKVIGKTLLEFVEQSPEAVKSAYQEMIDRDKKHFSYFTKVFFSHLQKATKGDKKHGKIDYENVDTGLYQ